MQNRGIVRFASRDMQLYREQPKVDAPDPGHADPKPYVLRGLIGIMILCGGFGTWAALAPLDSGVVTSGTLIVDGKRRKIQHSDGGVIRKLLVKEGDRVRTGQTLIQLDQTRAQATNDVLQGAYDAARAEEARLIAERDQLDDIPFPIDLVDRREQPEVSKILHGQLKLFEAGQDALVGRTEILNKQIEQSNEEIEGLRGEQISKERQIDLLQEELEGLRRLLKDGLTEKGRVLALERERERLIGDLRSIAASIVSIEKAIGETELEIIQLRKEHLEEISEALRDNQASLRDSREQLADAANVLDQIEIRAPIDGIVVNMQANTIGGVIAAGDTVLELVPVDEKLVVEAHVLPGDIDLVRTGQSANVLFSGFESANTPVLEGQVKQVSADRLVDEVTGDPFYEAAITIADSEIDRLGSARVLSAGMPADVMIVAGERTMFQYLFKPIKLAFQRSLQE